jgi:outer membrane protein
MVRREFFVCVAAAVAAVVAPAQSAATKVGVINIQAALVSTNDGKKAAAELEAKRAPKTKEMERRQAEIRSLQDSLNRGGNAMSEAAKAELVRNIDQKTKAFNRDLEDANAEWEQDQQKVINELGQKMMVVIDKYAKDNGYSLILDVSNPNTPVLYASNAIDITKDIIDLYDKNSASIAPPPAKPGATPTTNVAPGGLTPRPTAPPAAKPAATPPATAPAVKK